MTNATAKIKETGNSFLLQWMCTRELLLYLVYKTHLHMTREKMTDFMVSSYTVRRCLSIQYLHYPTLYACINMLLYMFDLSDQFA